jgi:hypothetical protein
VIAPGDAYEPLTATMRAELRDAYPDAARVWRAFVLAPTIMLCDALLSGEAVPSCDLDAAWVARLGLRRAA